MAIAAQERLTWLLKNAVKGMITAQMDMTMYAMAKTTATLLIQLILARPHLANVKTQTMA